MTCAETYLQPRLDRAVHMASAFLLEHRVTFLPIDPQALIRRCGWSLKTYSRIVERSPHLSTLEELIAELNSPDAATIFTGDRATILYNDTVTIPERIRFSLCHEIGHLILEHFTDFDIDNLSPAEKAALELEANVFAANLMAPVGVLMLLQHPSREQNRRIFGMSRQAWQMRLKTLSSDYACVDGEVIRQQQAQFHDFMYARICECCGHAFISAGTPECPRCRSTILRWRQAPPRPVKVICKKTRVLPASAAILAAPPEPARPTFFPMTPENWSEFTFACMREADRAQKKHTTRIPALFADCLGENPMVIDELWNPPTPRRKSHGKHRPTPPHC